MNIHFINIKLTIDIRSRQRRSSAKATIPKRRHRLMGVMRDAGRLSVYFWRLALVIEWH